MATSGEGEVAPRAEVVAALSAEGIKCLEALEGLQTTADAHVTALFEERKALELKYHALHVESWKLRSKTLSGEADGSAGIPKFWLQAMTNHPKVADFIEERDEEALASLKDITWEFLPELKGFKFVFTFGPNEFFEDSTLTKEFHVPNLLEGKAIELEKSIGSEVHWKAGKDLTHATVKKKGKGGKKGKTVTKVEAVPSFFRFFESLEFDEEKAAEMEEEEVMAVYQQMQAEADVAFALKDKIVPNAVHWFTGEAVDDDDDEDDGEDDDEEGEDDEEEEDEEEDYKPKKGKGKGKRKNSAEDEEEAEEDPERSNALKAAFEKQQQGGGGGDAEGDKPPECKQS